MFEDALRLASWTERLDRLDSRFADDDDFAWFDVPHVGRADQIKSTRLGTNDPGISQPSESQRTESMGVADADQAIAGHHHKRECTADLRDGVDDCCLNSLLTRPGKEVDHDLRVAVGLKNGTGSHERVPQFAGIHKVAVVTHGQLAVDAVNDDRMCVGDQTFSGGGIANVTDSEGARKPGYRAACRLGEAGARRGIRRSVQQFRAGLHGHSEPAGEVFALLPMK